MNQYKDFIVGNTVIVPLTDDRLVEGKIINIVKTIDKGILLDVEGIGYVDPYDVFMPKDRKHIVS